MYLNVGIGLAEALASSIVNLLKAIVAVVVAPLDENGSVVDIRTILAPSFEADMCDREGSHRRPLPRKFTLSSIGPEYDNRAALAIAFAPSLVLTRVTHIEDTDRTHKIKL